MCPRFAKRASGVTDVSVTPETTPSTSPAKAPRADRVRGLLTVVPTPIGNVADISLRALDVLKSVDLIAAEDPQVTRRLLDQYDIATEIRACAGRAEQVADILTILAAGRTVALVCDAGAPAIADPGAALVAAAIAGGHRVTALPGPVAAIVALIASGLPPRRFVFDGFPPRGRADREAYFASLAGERRTLILYESAPYLRSTLRSLHCYLPADCRVAIASDLTTPQEAIWRGTLSASIEWVGTHPPRGSYTLILGCST